MKPTSKCCFCGKEFTGWGNNPWPANKEYDATCCDECNITVVIPARVKQAQYDYVKDYAEYDPEQSK